MGEQEQEWESRNRNGRAGTGMGEQEQEWESRTRNGRAGTGMGEQEQEWESSSGETKTGRTMRRRVPEIAARARHWHQLELDVTLDSRRSESPEWRVAPGAAAQAGGTGRPAPVATRPTWP